MIIMKSITGNLQYHESKSTNSVQNKEHIIYIILLLHAILQYKILSYQILVFVDFILLYFSTNAVLQYIDKNFEAYLQEEMMIKRSLGSYHDTRVHVCLYFIAPTGHS